MNNLRNKLQHRIFMFIAGNRTMGMQKAILQWCRLEVPEAPFLTWLNFNSSMDK